MDVYAKLNGFTGGFVHGGKIADSSYKIETWKKPTTTNIYYTQEQTR